jgi:signal transduction histidine kinase
MERYVLQAERLAAMGSISAALAHEVKNPLQAIRSNLELVLEFPLEPDEKQDCLEICQHEVERLMSITQRVLSFARPEKRAFQPFSFAEVWRGALELMKRALEVASIRVINEVPDNLPPIIGISDQISQVIVNLLLNAIESMPEGGMIKGTAQVEDAQLIFTMINSGPPIGLEYIDHIFDPFFTTKSEGSGLGLFICHNIVREHGGTISVENLSEGGVAFTIRLPAAGAKEND